tara:strand:- start:85 stop:372 length:288 start_codon:yes stop_codon:yes gene_type:complete
MSRNRNVVMSSPIDDSIKIAGTPVQQHWKILNFHEKRINKIESYLGKLDKSTNGGVANDSTMSLLNNLIDDVRNLKTDIDKLKKGNNSISLDLEE